MPAASLESPINGIACCVDVGAGFADHYSMRSPRGIGWILSLCILFGVEAQVAAKQRPLRIDDLDQFQDVADPRCSPDGRWVAYTVTSTDREADKRKAAIWMISWDGRENVRLTYGQESATSPRWSPDGRYLSFLSSRPGEVKGSQVWVLDRRGGDARQLTSVKDKLDRYEWSPDSKKLVLVVKPEENPNPEPPKGESAPTKPPKPVVTDRYHFKQDEEGYLTANSHSHLYLFDVAALKLDSLTSGTNFDELFPAWSPDSASIAFASNHDPDPDRTVTADIFVIDAHPGAAPRKVVSTCQPDHQQLAWSPDGKLLAYLQGSEAKFAAYNVDELAVVPAAGGPPRVLTTDLDRPVSAPEFTAEGNWLLFLVADDRSQYPAQVPVSGGSVQRLVPGKLVVSALSSSGGHTAVRASTDKSAPEIFALEGGSLRKLTSHNDVLFAELQLGEVEDISFESTDGSEIHGMMIRPPSYRPGQKYPTLLWIHGGPNGQDAHDLDVGLHPLQAQRQWFAANGYIVLVVNYRGSSGRGAQFTRCIAGDWGNKEVADLLAGVDHVLKLGLADPDRLGIGGWSYGGLLTDYVIASDTRFKAAISGAGCGNQVSVYGADQYVLQYDNEVGPPWRRLELWLKVSYPFFKADRIRTPTLFMGGERDFNVPIIGSEQMYQALRSREVPTQLVVYPGEFHMLTRPSFIRDRLERDLAWFDKYVGPGNKDNPVPR
jgi:dipeptidyl aminopeptidase/acylaminoacyl peptidase